ncbi:glycosyltransferase family 2 protein [Colwelliaceae bacterium MEBiC 14330]
MLISIISATFNSADEIMKTYDSIKKQTHQKWEWLVTDDCSVDNTFQILKEIQQKDERVFIFKNKVNSGAAVSRNLSLKHVKGDFIAFIDSDDIWVEDKLEKQIIFMGDNINFSFTAYSLIDENGKCLNQVVDSKTSGSFTYQDMLKKKATLGCSTVMLRSMAFPSLTMPLLRTGQDYATWLKILKKGEKAFVLAEPLTKYRIMPNSISRNKLKKAKRQWQIYRELEKLRLIESMINFCFYAWRAVFRK